MRRCIAWVGVGLLVAGATAWLLLVPEPTRVAPSGTVPSVELRKAEIVLRRRGQRQAEITAERLEVSADGRLATFAGAPRVRLFVDGRPALTLNAGRVVLDRTTQDVRVEEGLQITTSRGEIVTAPRAFWRQETGVLDLVDAVAQQPAPSGTPGAAVRVPEGQGRLRADRIRYDTKARVILATGNVSLVIGDLLLRADSLRLEQGPQIVTVEGGVTVQQRETRLTAARLRYEVRSEIAEATGDVVLVRKDATIKAPQMRFELREDIVTATGGVEVQQNGITLTAATLRHQAATGDVIAEGGVRLVRQGSTLSGGRLQANLNTKRADVRDDVKMVRAPGPPSAGSDRTEAALAREETTVTAARVAFRWDTDEAEAEGNVVVRQKEKTASAERMLYSEPSNRMVLAGSVRVEQLGEWLVREGLVTPPQDSRERQALASLTRLTCNRLTMTLKERDVVAEGSVRVTQKERWASGDRATYTETTRLLVVTGNVRMQEADGQRLQADRVVISLKDETFEAEGNVQTEFVIRPSPTPTRTP